MPENKNQTPEAVKSKILHLLTIYPVISPTMLQSGLGPYTKPDLWRPVLAELITEGLVIESQQSLETPSGRYNTYTILSNPNMELVDKRFVRNA